MSPLEKWIIPMVLRVPALLAGITVHEFFHAWTAWKLGDDTPMRQGRVTLNPLAHLDPIGTIMILFVGFGWGRPVQIDPHNFRDPRRDDLLVSVMGPVSNLGVAIGFAIALKIMLGAVQPSPLATKLAATLALGVWINVALMVFNLIPLYPLDGSHVLAALLPPRQYVAFSQISRYSPFILLAVILFFGQVLMVPISIVADLITRPFGLNLGALIHAALPS